MNETEEQAVAALDGMKMIVKNEMLRRGHYLSEDVENQELAKSGAICGGHSACAIGSLWMGAGIKPVMVGPAPYQNWFALPGVELYKRKEFLSTRPALKLAYDSLNHVAQKYIDKNKIILNDVCELSSDNGAMERLFESSETDIFNPENDPLLDREDLLKIIKKAKRRIKK